MNDQNKFHNPNSDLKLFDFDLDTNESNDLDTNNFNFDDAIGDQPILDGSNNQLNSLNSSSNLLIDDNDALGNQQQHRRSRASGDILTLLVHEFNKNSNPSTSTRKAISNKTGMSERSVRIWFQNRRAKARKIEKLSQNDNNSANGGANRRSSTESSSKFLGGKKAQSFSSFQNQQKLPISINEKYSLIDCISVSVGPWQRIKSGYLNGAILKNLHNLSPRLLNNLMLTTDLLIILSKRDNELNYFFSGVFQNEKVLFRIFFPLANILNCSLINNQTQQTITTNYSNNTASTTTTSNNGLADGEASTNSNPSSTAAATASGSTALDRTASNTTNDVIGAATSSKVAGNTSTNTSPNNTDTSPDNVSGNQRNSLYNDEFDYPEHSQLRLQLTSPPKFAVYFLRDPTTGQENANQWSICEDFSEDQQVVSAYVGEGGTKIPHILTGDLDYLQYLNSWIVSYNQYHSAHQNNQLSQQFISQQIDDLILRNNSNKSPMNDNNSNSNQQQQHHNSSTLNLNDNMNTLHLNNTQNNNINHNNNDNPDNTDILFNDNLFSRDFSANPLVNPHILAVITMVII
ncbi:unnamed protein product [[Candida] boidinii]|uniref:Unnamed protein product n=1 Tax=Candida boidinii TaxID=5477 RepID=A0A9W6WFN8_CANBO|nr:unnamed protein product [[Candida] boidinii]